MIPFVPVTWRDPAEHRRKLAEGINWILGRNLWHDVVEPTTLSGETNFEWAVEEGYVYRLIGYEIEKSGSSFLWFQSYESGAYVTSGYTWRVTGGSFSGSDTMGALEATTTTANLNIIAEFHEAGSANTTHVYARNVSDDGGVTSAKRNSAVAATKLKVELSASATMDGGVIRVQRRLR